MAKNNKTHFFFVSYADKTWVFDQSERARGLFFIIDKIELIIVMDKNVL